MVCFTGSAALHFNGGMRRLIAFPFVLSLMLVGCGGGADDSASPADTSTSASASSSQDNGTGNGDGYGGGGGGGSTDAGGGDDVAGIINISGFAYGDPLTVAPGALVLVVNEDPQAHSVTAGDGSFDTGLIDSGAELTFLAPATPGTYDIRCIAHAQMGGQLIVAG